MRVSEYPVNLDYFCRATACAMGDAPAVLENMTLAGFFQRVGGHPWRSGRGDAAVAIAGFGLAALSHGESDNWRACAHCIRSDISTYGTSYWHRSHQLPTSFYCLQHSAPLLVSSVPKAERYSRFQLPHQSNFSEISRRLFVQTENSNTLQRLSQLAMHALNQTAPPVEPALKHEVMLQALEQRGFVTAGGSIRRTKFIEAISKEYGFLSVSTYHMEAVSQPALGILHRSMKSVNKWRRPIHNLVLLDWLFGSWDAFQKQCFWQSVMDEPIAAYKNGSGTTRTAVNNETTQPSDYASIRSVHRMKYLEFNGVTKNATRSSFARASPKSFRWLLTNDQKWFDAECAPSASANPGRLF